MSFTLKDYTDYNSIIQSSAENRIFKYSLSDINAIKSVDAFTNFGLNTNDIVECHLYDMNGELLQSSQKSVGYTLSEINKDLKNRPTIVINPNIDLANFEIGSGNYKIVYNFLRNLIGSYEGKKLIIKDISPDRTELRVLSSDTEDKEFNDKIIEFASFNKNFLVYWPELYINFSFNELFPIVNWQIDTITTTEYPFSLILKLYKPLPELYKEKNFFWITEVVSDSVVETINYNANEPIAPSNTFVLRGPNYNIDIYKKIGRETEYKSWDDMLGTNSYSSQQLIDAYLSSSISGMKLNIDYSDYSNFIHFSSAANRLENFKYKLELIEYYDNRLATLSSLSGSVSSSITVLNEMSSSIKKRDSITSGLDDFEKYMYYESGSNYSSSFGYIYDKTWPKTTSTKPYIISSTSSSIAIDWFESEYVSASEYDNTNRDRLIETIPFHIRDDEDNSGYILFIDMLAQHFDILWAYIKNISEIYNKDNKLTQGIPKDLIYHIVESLGWKLDEGNTIENLWEYLLSLDDSGNYMTGSNGLEIITPENRMKEYWKRIFNNLPFLLKTKGTRRGISALLTSYGIPRSILRIKEYGGTAYSDSSYIIDKFIYALDFKGNQYLETDWKDFNSVKPDTVQFRFRTVDGAVFNTSSYSATTQSLVSVESASNAQWAITLEQSSSVWGFLKFSLSGSNGYESMTTPVIPVFDNNFYGVMLNRETSSAVGAITQSYNLYVKKYYQGRMTHFVSSSLIVSESTENDAYNTDGTLYIGNTVTLGTDSYSNLTGSLHEFRLWRNELSESAFDAYVQAPVSYFGNTETSSFTDLLVRYSLHETQSHFSASAASMSIYDYNPSQYAINYASASGFPSESYYSPLREEYYMRVPKYWGNKLNSDKIRIETNELNKNLSSKLRVEKITSDSHTIDSQKIGVNLSPIDIINDDIYSQLGDFEFDNYIGNPQDQYNRSYIALDELRNHYFKKYPKSNDYEQYFNYIKTVDKSLFKQIRKMLPARSNAIVGMSFEPNFLNRSKYNWRKMQIESSSLSDTISYAVTTKYDNPDYEANGIPLYSNFETSVSDLNMIETLDIGAITTADYSLYQDIIDVTQTQRLQGVYAGVMEWIDNPRPSIRRSELVEYGKFSLQFNFTSSTDESDIASTYAIFNSPESLNEVSGVFINAVDINSKNQKIFIETLGTLPTNVTTLMRLYKIPSGKLNKVKGDIITNFRVDNATYVSGSTNYISASCVYLSGDKNPYVDNDIVEIEIVRRKLVESFIQDYSDIRKNGLYKGSLQTEFTTLDGKPPVEIFESNPNKMKVQRTDSTGNIKIE